MQDGAGQELQAKIFGQEWSSKNLPVNTIFTVLTFLLVGGIAALVYNHEAQSAKRDEGFVAAIKDQTSAIRDQTSVAREQICWQRYQGSPTEKAEFCKSVR